MYYNIVMKKLSGINFSDIIAYPGGLIVVRELTSKAAGERRVILSFDNQAGAVTPVPEEVYLSNKFGPACDLIAAHLAEPGLCEAVALPDGRVFAIYPTGECALFSPEGEIVSSGAALYRDCPASSACCDGKVIWTCVSEQNVILSLRPDPCRFIMRIGAPGGSDFERPVSVSFFDGYLYVCCEKSRKIIRTRPGDFELEVYKVFKEPVYKYLIADGQEFVVLASGLYTL